MPAARALHDFMRLVFLEDWPLKIVCFLLAALSWFYIDGELTDERELTVPFSSGDLKLPAGMEVAPEMKWPPFYVRVRGPRRRLQYLGKENILLNIPQALAEPVRGDNSVVLRAEVVGIPGMEVLRVDPLNLNIKLLGTYRKLLPVHVRRIGDPRSGYLISKMSVEPKEIPVESPHDLQQAEAIYTEPLEVTDKAADFKKKVRIVPLVPIGEKEVEVRCAETVEVTIQISRVEKDLLLEGVPVRTLAPTGTALSVEPERINITVTGPPEELDALQKEDLRLFVEWPADWDASRPPGHVFPATSLQVRSMPLPRLLVRDENKLALPIVKIQGMTVKAKP